MSQLTLDDFISVKKELILCSLSLGYHWIRISAGGTPEGFKKRIQFTLDGYEYLYENTVRKDKIINAFDGSIHETTWKRVLGGEKSE